MDEVVDAPVEPVVVSADSAPGLPDELLELSPEMVSMLQYLALDMVIVAFAVVAILTTFKQVVKIAGADILDRKPVQIFLEFSPLVLGAALAAAPGLFDGFDLKLDIIFGLISGFMSPGLYSMVKKRLPGLMVSSDARAPAEE